MKDLRSLYRQGFIPGPREAEEAFRKRIALFKKKERQLESSISLKEKDEAFSITRSLYQIVPDWVEVIVSSKGLHFWEAGAAWEDENGRWKISLNPKQQFAARAEVLGHEAVHVARATFNEKRFEEILAFRTSSKGWRRFFGPLFQHPKEVWLFFLATLLDCIWSIRGGTICATLLIFSLGLLRLFWNQWRVAHCLQRLPCPALVICLTDSEIITLAKGGSFSQLDDGSLRWRMINACEDLSSEAASCFDT